MRAAPRGVPSGGVCPSCENRGADQKDASTRCDANARVPPPLASRCPAHAPSSLPNPFPHPQAPAAAAALTLATALPAHASSSASLDNFIGSLVAGGLLFAAIAGAVVFVSTFDTTVRR